MKICCFGDSNTYGYDPQSYFGGRYDEQSRWVDILKNKTGWHVDNAGQNGLSIPCYESDISLYRKILCASAPDLIIIMLGSNDLLQNYSAKAVAQRMERFLRLLQLPEEKLLLISPVPFTSGHWIDNENCIEQSALLGKYFHELADKMNISFANAGDWDIPLCSDGVHYTASGHRIFAEKIYNIIFTNKEK